MHLVSPAGRHRSVAAIARARGLDDTAHGHRRFREAHGVTPGRWRAGHR